ncbi:MAG: class I SAM-dependent methyltransferase [Proteobacteria bacterium]|nr:class I SAM-dependent methyltransferase [Pseudomonadota bacterium]
MKKLEDSQVEAFDTEYVDDVRWETIKAGIDQGFPAGKFTFLDLGGGNGRFADRVLAAYPNSKGTVLDSSEVLISRNQPSERKTVILDSVENFGRIDARYDIVFLHWLLHHVVSDSYAHTRRNQIWTLNAAGEHLTAGGRISVFENLYDGLLIDNLPGRIIYRMTSSRALSGLTRRLGANTAGVGVCFLSKKEWLSSFREAGLQVIDYAEPDTWSWSLPLSRTVCLNIQRRYAGHFWLGVQ